MTGVSTVTTEKAQVAACEPKKRRLSGGRATSSHLYRKQFGYGREKFCVFFKYNRNINSHELFAAACLIIPLTNE